MLVHYLHKVEGKDGTWHSDLLQQWLCFSCWCWHTGETSKGQEEYGFTVLFLFLYHATASISTHLLNRARRLTCFLELQEEGKKKKFSNRTFLKTLPFAHITVVPQLRSHMVLLPTKSWTQTARNSVYTAEGWVQDWGPFPFWDNMFCLDVLGRGRGAHFSWARMLSHAMISICKSIC